MPGNVKMFAKLPAGPFGIIAATCAIPGQPVKHNSSDWEPLASQQKLAEAVTLSEPSVTFRYTISASGELTTA